MLHNLALEAHSVVRRVLIIQSPDHRQLKQRIGEPTLRNFLTFVDGQKMGRSLSNSIYFIPATVYHGNKAFRQPNKYKISRTAAMYLCNGSRVHKRQEIGGPAYRITNSLFPNTEEFLLCAVPYGLYGTSTSTVQPQPQCNPLTDSTPKILVNPRTFYFRSGRRESPTLDLRCTRLHVLYSTVRFVSADGE